MHEATVRGALWGMVARPKPIDPALDLDGWNPPGVQTDVGSEHQVPPRPSTSGGGGVPDLAGLS